jgi:hypothetical protein
VAPGRVDVVSEDWTNILPAPASSQVMLVGDTGFEPVTSSVSRKRATAAPIAREGVLLSRWVRDLNPCKRICSPLPRLSANPPLDGFETRSERTTRLELATSTLARLRSTN